MGRLMWQEGLSHEIIITIVTQGWVVNGVRRHAEPLGDNDPPQLTHERRTSMNLQSARVRGTEKMFSRSDIQLSRLGT